MEVCWKRDTILVDATETAWRRGTGCGIGAGKKRGRQRGKGWLQAHALRQRVKTCVKLVKVRDDHTCYIYHTNKTQELESGKYLDCFFR